MTGDEITAKWNLSAEFTHSNDFFIYFLFHQMLSDRDKSLRQNNNVPYCIENPAENLITRVSITVYRIYYGPVSQSVNSTDLVSHD